MYKDEQYVAYMAAAKNYLSILASWSDKMKEKVEKDYKKWKYDTTKEELESVKEELKKTYKYVDSIEDMNERLMVSEYHEEYFERVERRIKVLENILNSIKFEDYDGEEH